MTEGFFTWIEPNALVASRRAHTVDEFDLWSAAGVTLVLNLDTEPDDHNRLGWLGIRYVHFPLEDFTAPEPALIIDAIREIETEIESGGIACVHCRAGLGRTGTIVASWLVHRGLRANEAIDRVRSLRPGSIETAGQVDAVHGYARSRGTGVADDG